MRLLRRKVWAILPPLLFLQASLCLKGQEAEAGFHLPVVVSANGLFTNRFETRLPRTLATIGSAQNNPREGAGGGLRILASPSVRFNDRWFAHTTLQFNTEPFFPYEAYHVQPRNRIRVLQGYLGYTRGGRRWNATVKAGQLATAFGDFSRRYSDAANALIDAPAAYGSYLLLRPDEVPCSNYDLQHQQQLHPNVSAYHCAPWESYSYGILPVSPYGVFGAEVSISAGRLDARWQLANSSPSNPKAIWQADQSPQWSGGAGFSLGKGVRLGVSHFRGNWLDGKGLKQLKQEGTRNRFCACGTGIDGQYAWRRLSFNGEWMSLEYRYPGFHQSPRVRYGYGELKAIITPRLYLAGRAGFQRHGAVALASHHDHADRHHVLSRSDEDPAEPRFQPNKRTIEVAAGFRVSRYLLLKVGHQWVKRTPNFGPRDHVLAIQLVSTLPDFWKSFR